MRLTTDGLVLGTLNMGETDRIITILSGEIGILRAYAGGARKPGSRLSGSTELLCYSRFVLFKNKERYSADSADSNKIFFGVRQDIEKLALASYLCELSADTSPVGEKAVGQLRLLLNCLHLLETGKRPPCFLKPVFELRQISLSGYQPDLVACQGCGRYEGGDFLFFPESGGLLCAGCTEAEGVRGGIRLSPPVLAAMRHILYSEEGKLFSFSLADPSLKALCAVSERYIQAQLARSYHTLDFYHTLCG
ncbi:MAG: DNA repair protein RecO [Provencibacterium sp.]|nr:DNA repair protein RecO [Provencibacterium sp.]